MINICLYEINYTYLYKIFYKYSKLDKFPISEGIVSFKLLLFKYLIFFLII